jgi:hypothetical protein
VIVARLLRTSALGLVHFKYKYSHYLLDKIQRAMRVMNQEFQCYTTVCLSAPVTLQDRHKSILRNQFPPKSGIVLAFENPPDILRAVFSFFHEVPAGFEEYTGCLHLGCGLACAAVTGGLA